MLIKKKHLSISAFCKKHHISTNKLIQHLVSKNLLHCDKDKSLTIKDESLFYRQSNKPKIIFVKETILFGIIKNRINHFKLTDAEKYTLREINDTSILFEKVKATTNKTLMFLDFEYRNGDFYEVAFSIYRDGNLISQEYLFVYDDKPNRKEHFLRENKIPFRVYHKTQIHQILKNTVAEVDYIIGHNSYGERASLNRNGIILKKQKFICTADLVRKFNKLPKDITLYQSLELYKIKYDSKLHHLAIYDIEMTKNLFFHLFG